MPDDKLTIDTKPTADTGKVTLRSLADIDGRTLAARTAKALVGELESDAGGADRLSAGERALIVRAAITGAMCEDVEARWLTGHPIDVAAYTALTNNLRRLLTTVGLKRQPRDVTPELQAYIAERTEQPSELVEQQRARAADARKVKRAKAELPPCPISLPPRPGDAPV